MEVKVFNNAQEIAVACADIFTQQLTEKKNSVLGPPFLFVSKEICYSL